MEHLINIDNGGTLTDICVATDNGLVYAKTLTTPTDLSECLFKGITKASGLIYGEEDLPAILHDTGLIRYSSTQGTNALVERKGPKLGLITDDENLAERLQNSEEEKNLFQDLVGDRVCVLKKTDDEEEMDRDLVQGFNKVTTAGGERLVIAISDPERERKYKHMMLRRFPRHLLGSVPTLFSWEFTNDGDYDRRVWSAVLNSFLHPTVEKFLYSAEHRLRSHKVKNPLLIYRNDGASSRVAKSVALKTYSSGPRGGLEGTRALAEAYGFEHVLMIDIGGTTTDVGEVENKKISTERHGHVADIPISFELCDVRSAGVGGSSIIQVQDGEITVGPESVGAAPGPACFGFGGKHATITDVKLLIGILDPETYLNGELKLDKDRARAVVKETVADPLGISVEEAIFKMEATYAAKVSEAFEKQVKNADETTLACFGGGGPMTACIAARHAGIRQVIIPRLAAVFSAYGISFSDVAQTFEVDVTGKSDDEIKEIREELHHAAERHMFQEGYRLDECELEWAAVVEASDGEAKSTENGEGSLPSAGEGERVILELTATKPLPHPEIKGSLSDEKAEAKSNGTREMLKEGGGTIEAPVYFLEEQDPRASAEGPAIVEGPFFTCRVPAGWRLSVTDAGDLLLNDEAPNA